MKSDCDECFEYKEIEVVDEYGLEFCKECCNKKSIEDIEFEKYCKCGQLYAYDTGAIRCCN